ncbi:MSHA biogenesis protein MshJ [Janthinobacterium sp. CG_23.3]|uniref:type II secretion system protein GspM n=1 Tax=Janthinobacterium sp. CG_23.3 TaxID=3349634 RepID=UPI0038D4BB76
MKQSWLKLAAKIDALSLRERVMAFAAGMVVLLFLAFLLLLDPMFSKQKKLVAQFRQQQSQMAGIDAEVANAVLLHAHDPDSASRASLQALRGEVAQLGGALRAMQKGLVAPERIVLLLEQLLRSNTKLRLVSLKTLPATGLADGRFSDPVPADAPEPMHAGGKLLLKIAQPPSPAAPPAAPVKQAPLLYRHGVELELQGGYLDMVNYMEALEAMPTQLFWGKANLHAGDYPNARLTLTLYTLSLAPKWIAL